MKEVYSASASSIIALERESGKNAAEGRLARIDTIEANWDAIVKTMDDNMPASSHMIEILKGETAYENF